MFVIAYLFIAFIIKVLINVFGERLPDDAVFEGWAFPIFWIISIPIALIVAACEGIDRFADWLGDKIKDVLGLN